MSENYHIYIFSCLDNRITFEQISQEVEKVYEKAKVIASDLTGGLNSSGTGHYSMSLKVEGHELKAIKKTLDYLFGLPSLLAPYAKIEFEQVNESVYYTRSRNKMLSFEDYDELAAYLKKNELANIENSFFEKFSDNFSTLLVRVKIPNKKLIHSFYDLCLAYVNEPTNENYLSLKKQIDGIATKNLQWQCDFPSYTYASSRYLGHPAYAKSVVFCEKQTNYLFLGYAFDKSVHIDINQEYNGWPNCIKNIPGKQIKPMLEVLWAVSQQGLRAKFRTANYRDTNSEGYFSFISDQLCYREGQLSHDMVWQE